MPNSLGRYQALFDSSKVGSPEKLTFRRHGAALKVEFAQLGMNASATMRNLFRQMMKKDKITVLTLSCGARGEHGQ